MPLAKSETNTAVKLAEPAEKTETKAKIIFPAGFLLGAASASHQVEGDNINSDWWVAEQGGRVPKSGLAADHYHRFEEDFQIAHDIGLNAMRISFNWARIEPEEGRWDDTVVKHYKKVLATMKAQGLTRMVTLWHWAVPRWFAEKGGFESKEGVEAFVRYCWFVAQNFGQDIDLWVILNEPETYCSLSYEGGKHPPFVQSKFMYFKVLQNLISAHKKAYKVIKSQYPHAKVGIAKNMSYYEPYRASNLMDNILVFFANRIGNHYFLEKIEKHLDFVGINYYFFNRLKFDWRRFSIEMNHNFNSGQMDLMEQADRSDMGWLLHPEGIYDLLHDLKKYRKPIYITENGLADATDSRRPKYLREVLHWVMKAVNEGVDVKGYFHWALTDNYEWASGYGPRFGLVEIDYATQKRTVRKSASIFKEVEIK